MGRIIYFILISLFIFLFPTTIYSHGDQKSFEKEVNLYLVDIGYVPDTFEALNPSTFSFSLLDPKKEEKEFSDIWVRIENDGKTVFATSVKKQELGETTMIYTFPDKGNYELFVRYQNGDEKLAETSIPLEVTSSEKPIVKSAESFPPNLLFGLIIGILGGVTIATLIKKRK